MVSPNDSIFLVFSSKCLHFRLLSCGHHGICFILSVSEKYIFCAGINSLSFNYTFFFLLIPFYLLLLSHVTIILVNILPLISLLKFSGLVFFYLEELLIFLIRSCLVVANPIRFCLSDSL